MPPAPSRSATLSSRTRIISVPNLLATDRAISRILKASLPEARPSTLRAGFSLYVSFLTHGPRRSVNGRSWRTPGIPGEGSSWAWMAFVAGR